MNIIIKGQENHVAMHGDTIKKIVVYGGGKILFESDSNYLEEHKTGDRGVFTSVYDGRPVALILEKEPVRAIKENLNRKDNYYRKYTGRYSFESGYIVYIHESEISVTDDGEKLAHSSDREKNYLHAYTLHFKHGAIMQRLKVEKVPDAAPDFTPTDGGKWGSDYGTKEAPQYDVIKKSLINKESFVVKRWREKETIYSMETKSGCYCRTEYSDFRIKAKEVTEKINKQKIFYKDVSFFEIEKLLEVFDLVEKC